MQFTSKNKILVLVQSRVNDAWIGDAGRNLYIPTVSNKKCDFSPFLYENRSYHVRLMFAAFHTVKLSNVCCYFATHLKESRLTALLSIAV
jgi:hypothetical protein